MLACSRFGVLRGSRPSWFVVDRLVVLDDMNGITGQVCGRELFDRPCLCPGRNVFLPFPESITTGCHGPSEGFRNPSPASTGHVNRLSEH